MKEIFENHQTAFSGSNPSTHKMALNEDGQTISDEMSVAEYSIEYISNITKAMNITADFRELFSYDAGSDVVITVINTVKNYSCVQLIKEHKMEITEAAGECQRNLGQSSKKQNLILFNACRKWPDQ